MFGRVGFFLRYVNSMGKNQYSSFLRYAGEYNIIILTFLCIGLDHYLENKIRKELQRTLQMQSTFDKIRKDVEIREEAQD
jgi:hypothetical protein